jgi:hypothetical protein
MTGSIAYQWIFSGIGVLLLSWIGTWIYRRSTRKQQKLKSEQHIEGEVHSASQVKISNSTVNGPVAGRDINIANLVQSSVPIGQTDDYHEKPTPGEIRRALQSVSLYLQHSVAASYHGHNIRWQTRLSNIHPLSNGQIDVILESADEEIIVVVKAVLRDYPVLKTVRGGESVEVVGTIHYVQTNGLIHLKDARLKFLASASGTKDTAPALFDQGTGDEPRTDAERDLNAPFLTLYFPTEDLYSSQLRTDYVFLKNIGRRTALDVQIDTLSRKWGENTYTAEFPQLQMIEPESSVPVTPRVLRNGEHHPIFSINSRVWFCTLLLGDAPDIKFGAEAPCDVTVTYKDFGIKRTNSMTIVAKLTASGPFLSVRNQT